MEITGHVWLDIALTGVVMPALVLGFVGIAARRFKDPLAINAARLRTASANIALFFINVALYGIYFAGLAALAKSWVSEQSWIVPSEFWAAAPLWLTTLGVIILMDFLNYWNHRLLHTRPLWGVHAIHHSDRNMTWTTSYRIHVLEAAFMAFWVIALSAWMNLPVAAIAIAGAVRGFYNKYIHCQLGWTHGPLRRWIISPNYHRWHHAEAPEAHNKNFGDMLTVWDRMFGTYYDPGPCECAIGLKEGPHTIPEMLIHPFAYWVRPLLGRRDNAAAET